ncbi:hypothetical protein [Myxococcus landrumensis]|uniref:Uncharacterized protein n=1 Tax=Myxococcus landrumensis TaxID=2813577 RepID=A0ABX7NBK0_9BACT|nr:hypothetical protein [Myxococcus landrumus]QSQ14761.1 hypothetical protein JY572_01335 [Myxococcus landrumus]
MLKPLCPRCGNPIDEKDLSPGRPSACAACATHLDDDDTLDVWGISNSPLPFKNTEGPPSQPGLP